MKLTILKNNLKNSLDIVGRAIAANLNLPILSCVLFEASANQIKLSGTNLELAITKNISGKIFEEGRVAVPYGTLSSIVSNISSERINLEVNKQGNLVLKTDNYEANLQGVDPREFPPLPKIETKERSAQINPVILRDALIKVIVAGEVSDLRPEISGVLFSVELAGLKLVATDSFRLAEAKISGEQFKNLLKEGFKFTLPLRAAQELTRIIKDEEEGSLHLDKNQFFFETAESILVSRLIEGNFPDYETIVPKEIDTEVLVDRNELTGALRLASAFAGRTNDVKLKTKDKKIIEVYSSDNAVGENNYLIPAKISGPPTEVTFNWRYLLDGLKGGSGEEVLLGLSGGERPALIKNQGDDSYFYILMPIKAG